MSARKTYQLGPFASVVGVALPWVIGVITLAKWLIEGLF